MTLYEIDNQIQAVIDEMLLSVDENGELIGFDPERLEQLQMERTEKLENIACYIKNLSAEAAALKKEEDNLKARREVIEKKADRLKGLLSSSILSSGDRKFETPKCYVSFRSSKVVVVPDVNLLDELYLTKVTETKPNKVLIKDALLNGREVRGAYLEERDNIQIK